MKRQGLPTAAAAVLLTFTFTAGFTVYQLGRFARTCWESGASAAEVGYLALVVVIVQDIQLARSFMLVIVAAYALVGPLALQQLHSSYSSSKAALSPQAFSIRRSSSAASPGCGAGVGSACRMASLVRLLERPSFGRDKRTRCTTSPGGDAPASFGTTTHIEIARSLLLRLLRESQCRTVQVAKRSRRGIAIQERIRRPDQPRTAHFAQFSFRFSETMVFQHAYGVRLPQPYLRDVSEIHRNSRHLLALIDDVLDLSKLAAGRMGVRLELVNLGPCDTGIGRHHPTSDAEQRPVVKRRPAGNNAGIESRRGAHPSDTDQSLSNAAHVTSRGGIVVRVTNDSQELRIEVSDTGPGIASDALESIFDEFRQLTTSTGSSGLGWLCLRIVHLMNGRMWAESALDVGITIAFAFPVKKTVPLRRCGAGMMPARRDSQPPVFVVVCDPEADEVRLLQRHLDEIEVMAATDRDMAISMARDNAARAIIYNGECDHLPALDACPLPVVACPLPGPNKPEEI